LALLGPVASELNTGLPINHDVAALRAMKISVGFQSALLEMGLIRFVVLIVGEMCYSVSVTLAAAALSRASRRGRKMMHWREVSCAKMLQFRKKRCNFPKAR
jgi:hypothetical protein